MIPGLPVGSGGTQLHIISPTCSRGTTATHIGAVGFVRSIGTSDAVVAGAAAVMAECCVLFSFLFSLLVEFDLCIDSNASLQQLNLLMQDTELKVRCIPALQARNG